MRSLFRQSPLPLICITLFATGAGVDRAQNTSTNALPVIDVHVHAMDESPARIGPMCPNTTKFTVSNPRTKEAPIGWTQKECATELHPAAGGQHLKDVIAEMERLNVTAVVFGDPKGVQKWREAAPNRVIPGTEFSEGLEPAKRVPLDELRKDFTADGFKVM